MPQTVATLIAQALAAAGITHAFAVPGESYLPLLDAMRDVDVRLVTCRHEAAAANMAEAAAKLTGFPGVAMVTRGPGATHAAIGLHTAQQDSTPLLLLVGQVGDDMIGREAFQEMDYARVFGSIAKQVVTLRDPARVAEQMASALATTLSGRPGPVVVVLPDDRLALEATGEACAPAPLEPPAPSPQALSAIGAMLDAAERPVLMLGGPQWSVEDSAAAEAVATRLGLPIVTSWRRKDRFDNTHPHYAGELGLGANPALVQAVKSADLLLVVGARLSENATQGYTLIDQEFATRALVHVCADAEALRRTWQPRLAVQAHAGQMLRALATLPPRERPDWVAHMGALHRAWANPTQVQAGVNPAAVIRTLSETLPADTIYCNGAGNFAAWLHRFHRHQARRTQLAPTSGAMGYGYPAVLAAKVVDPSREAVCIAGDGDFMMSANEMATAAQYGLGAIVVVVDNGTFGTIRMHQEREYPARVIATELKNPDFVKYAEAFDAFAVRCEKTEDFPAALAAARQAAAGGRPALVHLITDAEQIAPGRTITDLRGG